MSWGWCDLYHGLSLLWVLSLGGLQRVWSPSVSGLVRGHPFYEISTAGFHLSFALNPSSIGGPQCIVVAFLALCSHQSHACGPCRTQDDVHGLYESRTIWSDRFWRAEPGAGEKAITILYGGLEFPPNFYSKGLVKVSGLWTLSFPY